MTYNEIFAKSFTRYEQKKFGYWAIIGSFILALSSFTLLKPYLGPLPILNFRLSMGSGLTMLVLEDTSNSQPSNISSPRPLNIITSQPSNIVISSQQSNKSISEPSNNIGNSQQPNISSSSQQSNISSSQQSNKSISQPSNNIGNSQQPNISISKPLSLRTSQPLNTISSQPSVSDREVNLSQETQLLCNVSDPKYDFCDAKGDVRIHGSSSTVFAVSSKPGVLLGNESWIIKPYARKTDKTAMGVIKEISVKAIVGQEEAPNCTLKHSVPAVIFSAGGYAGNHFHSFSDIIIPLFVASSKFQGEVQFAITNFQQYWVKKFHAILKQLSKYEIINIDADDRSVHCFPRVIVGLKQYKDLRIDPLVASKGYSIKEFRQLLRNAYSLKKSTAIKISNGTPKKPILLILSRQRSRKFTNVDEIAEMARSLGFEVVVSEATMNLDKFSEVVNSCDVMMGIHGAGLTNFFFLPTNAILIQVLPWGGFDWVASTYYNKPTLDTDIRYLEYRIKEEESSLLEQYPLDHPVFSDPRSIHKHDWGLFKSIYMDKQNVKIDVSRQGRFRATLLEALELLHR
ncbi:beta-1,2-xylosyltransferase XYXT1-like [Macadamia integrifolia]|uniref:beta-1,2-xylosyltransferase XYXT1-like n=1 Tax=Macadamia integrifolia TaxID=60698 RepID=UPI001C4FA016|nr:beta-1,2-xylosyltransferase XYXT1-like [Macadamia integrifolia]